MIPQILTFLDVETNGTSPTRDRIIEIGIVRVENGEIKNTYESLFDPQDYLPPEISTLTGIMASHLESAPTFRQEFEKFEELLKGSVIVAHNSRFDTAFLKAEYQRLGKPFSPKQICTAKLSRILFPRFKHHNLDSIIERFGLFCEPRHRAFPDAKVLWEFFQILTKNNEKEKLEKALKRIMKKPSLPKGIADKVIDKLPEKTGVYIFYGDKGSPLYVGKSVNIRTRVMSHFYESSNNTREFHISQQVTGIEHFETQGELEALLREKSLISSLKPLYNRQLREIQSMTCFVLSKTVAGYDTLKLVDSTQVSILEIPNILAVYKTKGKAKRALVSLSKDYILCNKLLGLEKGIGRCFGSQIESCYGACVDEESPAKYNVRFQTAFSKSKVKVWPFSGPIIIPEGEKAHLVHKWCYLGLIDQNDTYKVQELVKTLSFDWDTYKILANYVLKPSQKLRFKVLENASYGSTGISDFLEF